MGGVVYHVFNRGNGRIGLFRKDGDYQAFLELLLAGKDRAAVELLGFCLMPDHWHLVLRPRRGRDLSAYLAWVSNTHVRRYRSQYPRTSGHLYQGRFKSFPVEADAYLLTLLRYVEANPQRAGLVSAAGDWPWSSLGCDAKLRLRLLDPWPVARPRGWAAMVNEPLPAAQRQRVQVSLERGRPLGSDAWTLRMARRAGLEFTLNPRGRPRKQGLVAVN